METALWLVILVSLACGLTGALLGAWGLRRMVYSLQCDVEDLKDKVLIEVKRRAGEARQSKVRMEEEFAAIAAKAKPEPVSKNPWDF